MVGIFRFKTLNIYPNNTFIETIYYEESFIKDGRLYSQDWKSSEINKNQKSCYINETWWSFTTCYKEKKINAKQLQKRNLSSFREESMKVLVQNLKNQDEERQFEIWIADLNPRFGKAKLQKPSS